MHVCMSLYTLYLCSVFYSRAYAQSMARNHDGPQQGLLCLCL